MCGIGSDAISAIVPSVVALAATLDAEQTERMGLVEVDRATRRPENITEQTVLRRFARYASMIS